MQRYSLGNESLLHVGYFNYKDGGILNPDDGPNGPFRYDFSGLTRVVGKDNAWPHILVMGEGYCYKENNGAAAKAAAEAMYEAGGRHYIPLIGTLPRDWSMAPPVVFVDRETISIHRWHQPTDADFAGHKRNLLVASRKGRRGKFHIIAIHGDTDDGDMRLADAKKLRRYGESSIPCLVAGDWYCTPSGSMWVARDLDDPNIYSVRSAHRGRIIWEHHRKQNRPYRPDTRSLDYLLGWLPDDAIPWGERIEGIGFYDVAELARNPAPTQYHEPSPRPHRQLLCYDRFIVNDVLKPNVVPESYRVREALNPHPSDHLMVDVCIDSA